MSLSQEPATAPTAAAPTAPAAATVLFVDDEPNILASLRRVFHRDYRVLTAGSGAEGLALLAKEPVDVVVSDMRMPEMDGAVFLGQVAAHWPKTVRILLTGYAELSAAVAAVNKGRIFRFLTKPWDEGDLRAAIEEGARLARLEKERDHLEALTRRQNAELRELNAQLEARVKARTAELEQLMAMLEAAYESLKKNYAATVQVFANLIEARRREGATSNRQIAERAVALARHLGLSEAEIRDIEFAALLHDIGKLFLPDALLDKPFHALTAAEREQFTRYPVVGQGLLLALEPLAGAADIIRAHRERWDGQGYPDRLAGEAIPLGARLLAVVVDYEALQAGTLTIERMNPAAARAFLAQERGRRYDPRIVEAFLALLADDERTPQILEMRVRSDALVPGMTLTRDLVAGRRGMMMLPKGTRLDAALIAKIRHLERAMNAEFDLYIRPPGAA